MSTFFEQQITAKRRTSLLIGYFVLAVIFIIFSIYLAVTILLGVATSSEQSMAVQSVELWNPDLLLMVATAVMIIVLIGSLWKMFLLRSGGARVAISLGGIPISPDTNDRYERRLLNIVEEMSIASGLPVPPVFLLDDHSINAFAAGFTPRDAVIGVTQGTMRLLTRDELQGVIAHEFSHVLNGDMRLNLRLIGVLHGILIIGLTGYFILRSGLYGSRRSSSSSKDGGRGGILLFGLALYIIGYLGVFFGKLIKAAVSRQREFLADASAVQYTRNPDGIAGALKKIGGLVDHAKISSPNAEEVSHMFFADGLTRAFSNMFATHPPLMERIKRIDPHFSGEYQAIQFETSQVSEREEAAQATSGFSAAGDRVVVQPETISKYVAHTTPEHLTYAKKLIGTIPVSVLQATRETFNARAVIYALLLDKQQAIQEKQLRYIKQIDGEQVLEQTKKLSQQILELGPAFRLPLVDLTIPALRGLSPAQFQEFRTVLHQLANADKGLTLFEYALHHILVRHVEETHIEDGIRLKRGLPGSASYLAAQLELLRAISFAGSDDPSMREKAFRDGLQELQLESATYDPQQEFQLDDIDAALTTLESADETQKERLLQACVACTQADNTVSIEEAEMLRAIGDALDCPIPPFIPDALLR